WFLPCSGQLLPAVSFCVSCRHGAARSAEPTAGCRELRTGHSPVTQPCALQMDVRLSLEPLRWQRLSIRAKTLDLNLLSADLLVDGLDVIRADLLQADFFDDARGLAH